MYLGVDRASRLLVIVIICATGCAPMLLLPHSSCTRRGLSTHSHTHTHAALASGVYTGVVCPFRCTGGIGLGGGGGSGEGQIVYLLTSLTCWCSLVNVLRVKHLLFFHPSVSLLLSSLCRYYTPSPSLCRRVFSSVSWASSPDENLSSPPPPP